LGFELLSKIVEFGLSLFISTKKFKNKLAELFVLYSSQAILNIKS